MDLSVNFELLDPNVQKTGEVVTLKYDSIGWIEQPFATRVENVNPFHVVVYTGSVKLSPASDSWIRTIRLPDKNINGGTIEVSLNGGFGVYVDTIKEVTSNNILVDATGGNVSSTNWSPIKLATFIACIWLRPTLPWYLRF